MLFIKNQRPLFVAACLLGIMTLCGCAETQLAAHSYKQISGDYKTASTQYKVGKPYRVMGVNYTPQEDWDYVETGVASWYGPDFHGKPTANGERYDQWDMTAAHKTLPLPSIVRVTNLENGRSVKLKVNDRGPFSKGRIIDVSRRAAQLLEFEGKGTAKVRVEIDQVASLALKQQLTGESTMLASAPVPPPAYNASTRTIDVAEPIVVSSRGIINEGESLLPARVEARPLDDFASAVPAPRPVVSVNPQVAATPNNMYVQVGSFQSQENAQRLSDDVARLGNSTVSPALVNGQNFYRVRIGPLASVEEADETLAKAVRIGFRGAKIVVEDHQKNFALNN